NGATAPVAAHTSVAPFVHLDVQSCYSLYCSPSTPEDYAAAAAGHYQHSRQSQPDVRAIALADYGLHSAVKMAVACRAHGLQHILGLRVRVAPERAYRPWNERPGELILLAMDEVGWLNLVAL